MREPATCGEVRGRLARHGLPAERIDRIMRELSEHWEDLRAEAMAEGLLEEDAAAFANARLGPPGPLAESIVSGLRRGSWFGRHPVMTLCVFPLLLAPLLMVALTLPLWGLYELRHTSDKEGAQAVRDAVVIVSGVWLIYCATLLTAPVWLCRRIWRAGLGLRWVVATCSLCAVSALARFFDADVIGRKVSMGFGFPWRLDLQTASIVLLHICVVAGFFCRARRSRSHTFSTNQNQ